MFDVTVIGAGVVGLAIARELSLQGLTVAVIEAQNDVGMGTSKANTAILHTGFDAPVDSLEADLLRSGYPLLLAYCRSRGIAVDINGALLVAWNEEELNALPAIKEKGLKNGAKILEIDQKELYQLEPHLGGQPKALAALLIPDEGIIDPFSVPLSFAYDAKGQGVEILLGTAVTALNFGEHWSVSHSTGKTASRWLINAAGLGSGTIDGLAGFETFTITPRRGQLIVYDKFARPLLTHTLLPVPTGRTKGVLVAPTVFGNVLLGPTAEDLSDPAATETTAEGLDGLKTKGAQILPTLMDEEITATYSGLRAASEHRDYQLRVETQKNYICAGGIRSTGLSSSMGIAQWVHEALADAFPSQNPPTHVSQTYTPLVYLGEDRACFDPKKISVNSRYGEILCHCEKVSRAELDIALNAPIPPTCLDGVRRRTRILQGRCQGFYCQAEVEKSMEKILGTPNG